MGKANFTETAERDAVLEASGDDDQGLIVEPASMHLHKYNTRVRGVPYDNPILIRLAFPPAAAVLMDVETSSISQLRQ